MNQKFTPLAQSRASYYCKGSPVHFVMVELFRMEGTGATVVTLTFKNLFSRPLVVGPSSVLAVRLGMRADEEAEVWCDGRRRIAAPHGTVVEVRVHTKPLRLARINMAPFSSRLVAKFHLPVTGWRDRGSGSA